MERTCKTCEIYQTAQCRGLDHMQQKNKKLSAKVIIFNGYCGMWEQK